MGISFIQLILSSANSFSQSTHFFPPSRGTLYRVKLFGEASELFTRAVFEVAVVRKTTPLECVLQGAKKM